MLTRRNLLAGMLLSLPSLIVTPSRVLARSDDPDENPHSLYAQLFPNPTGANGYEELILAGDRLQEAKAAYFRAEEFTLTKKQEYIGDPACQEALILLRRGLAKPMHPPEKKDRDNPAFLSYARFRSLARLLAVAVHIDFAEGRNDQGISIAADGLALGNVIKGESLIGLMVGKAIDSIVLSPLVQLRNSWSIPDCKLILALAEYHISLPDLSLSARTAEKEMSIRSIALMKSNFTKFQESTEAEASIDEDQEDTEESRRVTKYMQLMRDDLSLRERIFGELSFAVSLDFERVTQQITHPEKEIPVSAQYAQLHEITRYLSGIYSPGTTIWLKPCVENRILPKLLAIHAAIRRHRWETDRLPKALTELRLAQHIISDPFTGKPLEYAPDSDGINYRLASVGALVHGENGEKDKRQPFLFPPPRKI